MNPAVDDPTDGRAPVSRIQRFLPFLSYSLMSLGGAAAGFYVLKVVNAFGNAETAGIGEIARSLTNGMWSVTTGLVMAMIVGFVAIVVYVAMMFAQKNTASPSSIWLLVVALMAMIAPILSWPTLTELLLAPLKQNADPQKLMSSASTCGIAAIVIGLATPVAGLVLTFLPMRSRLGKKFGPLIVMVVIEALMLTAVVYLTLQVRSITRMALGY